MSMLPMEKLDCSDRSPPVWPEATMISIKMDVEITETRHLEIDLPQQVKPGKHEMIMILDEARSDAGRTRDINDFAGSIAWKIDGLELQRQLRREW